MIYERMGGGDHGLKLSGLIEGLPVSPDRPPKPDAEDPEITGIANDSRQVLPGFAFVCVRGLKDDGHRYAADAVRRGARAVFTERDVPSLAASADHGRRAVEIRVPDSREALARLGAAFFGHPSRRLSVFGVTGTNGKTTTAYMIESILAAAGRATGLIGTVETHVGAERLPAGRTTPESHELQALLARMVDAGATAAVMEVSSHALALKRVTACEIDVAVFTNITHDHFDFHDTFENYLAAKAGLFRDLGRERAKSRPKYAVINADDPSAGLMRDEIRAGVGGLTFGLHAPADVRAADVRPAGLGSEFTVLTPDERSERIRLVVPGAFNVSNALAALAVAHGEGIPLSTAAAALAGLRGVPGRYEVVSCGQDFTVMVDFAHNPDALENILRFARRFTDGRVIVVFGCEGAKDRKKRPVMGRVAARHAHHAIITSDNLYDEDALDIAAEIMRGYRAEAAPLGTCEVIPNRREAIERALEMADRDDMVVIAGKGHETYQVVGDLHIPFNDVEVTTEILTGAARAGAAEGTARARGGRGPDERS
jgi:UDP-N-acetylmuramoyl-L-alanyl-D-glutamate--2,6-diaminopimelate ligase